MLTQLSIPKQRKSEGPPGYQELYANGLKHIRELSHKIWTDYNVHDPGITILELLCYALTDLGYRASFPVKDLLAGKDGTEPGQFFTAREILPNHPLTELDYRKIIIDQPGVKNAWISKHELSYYADTIRGELFRSNPVLPGVEEVPLAGLYDIRIEYEETIRTPEERTAVREQVHRVLNANRNICEDFVGLTEVETQSFNLCAEIELKPDTNPSAVKAEIYLRIQNYLCPDIRFYSLDEMFNKEKSDGRRYHSDEIFDGPLLNHGFIADDELEASGLKTRILLSDIISEIMDIKGVIAIRDILFLPGNAELTEEQPESFNKWVIPVEVGKKPVLTMDFLDDSYRTLKFYKRNMPVFTDLQEVASFLQQLRPKSKSELGTAVNDIPIPLGSYRNPGQYFSFQNHFPATFGISEAGLSPSESPGRQAQALQLKAYLLFYDQLMANYFSQLSHVKDLFSTDPAIHRTYFEQVVDSFTDYAKIYPPGPVEDILESLNHDPSLHAERRNRFLDHLISRFAERFHDFANMLMQAIGSSAESIAGIKADFLSSYATNSRERSKAYNYSLGDDADLWDSANISGLEFRIAKLTGMRNFLRRNLSDFDFTIYSEIDGSPGDEFRFRVRHKDTGKIILSSSTRYVTEAEARAEMRKALRLGMLPSGYQRKTTIDNRFYFNIVDQSAEVIARRIEYFTSEELMNRAIDDLILYLQDNYSDEGMYLVENILLRPDPMHPEDPFLPICTIEQQTSCSDFDPYSYRVHIILPAENGRFRNMQFRQFMEEVIREETPAHILPKICWISKEDMAMLEDVYRDWIYLKAGRDTNDRKAKLERFIGALFEVKNIYPTQQLRDCNNNNDKFILGSTSLGSLENEPV